MLGRADAAKLSARAYAAKYNEAKPPAQMDTWTKSLFESAEKGNPVSLVKAIQSGGNIEFHRWYEGATPVIVAAKEGHLECVGVLLGYGASINARDFDGWTALMWASCNGHTSCVMKLLEWQADPLVKDLRGETAGTLALSNEHEGIANLLGGTGTP